MTTSCEKSSLSLYCQQMFMYNIHTLNSLENQLLRAYLHAFNLFNLSLIGVTTNRHRHFFYHGQFLIIFIQQKTNPARFTCTFLSAFLPSSLVSSLPVPLNSQPLFVSHLTSRGISKHHCQKKKPKKKTRTHTKQKESVVQEKRFFKSVKTRQEKVSICS